MLTVNAPTFVKWAGGKRQLIEQFKVFFPNKAERYFEPFVGSGAVAFYMIQKNNLKEIYLSDINEELINCYSVIKNNVEELIEILKEYKKNHNKEFYYKVREQDSSLLSHLYRAARFIYLNKTCFNGLYRVNSQGKFNVPMGDYKNPGIVQEQELRFISKLLKCTTLKVMSFDKVLEYAKKGDFVYFDPPYYPLKKGKNFTTYTKDRFLETEQIRLAEVFKELDKRGCSVMLSNSDTDFVKNLYGGFNIHTVKANRMINCDATKRGKINEIVVTNYPANTKGLLDL